MACCCRAHDNRHEQVEVSHRDIPGVQTGTHPDPPPHKAALVHAPLGRGVAADRARRGGIRPARAIPALPRADAYADVNALAQPDAFAHPLPYADPHADAYADSHADADPNALAHQEADPAADQAPHADAGAAGTDARNIARRDAHAGAAGVLSDRAYADPYAYAYPNA